ncbi:MAG: lysophospholipid acyltransferase family protein [Candidatus Omnitrophica bacterium]|nr:lysophospholipid acyltransferase family protein [Candidatus Omnitrophota bacterium]
MVYYLLKALSGILLKWYLGFHIDGRERVPSRGALIVCANHSSYLDPLVLAQTVRRPLYFMARDRLFRAPVIGWIVKHANSFPVRRHGDMSALKKALRLLREGRPLVLFPEGTRSKNRQLKRAKPGVGFLISKAAVPVLPVYIGGTFDAMPRGFKTLKRHPVIVRIGKPVLLSDTFTGQHGETMYQAISDEVMKQIALLKGDTGAEN